MDIEILMGEDCIQSSWTPLFVNVYCDHMTVCTFQLKLTRRTNFTSFHVFPADKCMDVKINCLCCDLFIFLCSACSSFNSFGVKSAMHVLLQQL